MSQCNARRGIRAAFPGETQTHPQFPVPCHCTGVDPNEDRTKDWRYSHSLRISHRMKSAIDFLYSWTKDEINVPIALLESSLRKSSIQGKYDNSGSGLAHPRRAETIRVVLCASKSQFCRNCVLLYGLRSSQRSYPTVRSV